MKEKNYGYIPSVVQDEHYVLGGVFSLPKVVVRPDGQWDDFLPTYEAQYTEAFDTDNCTGYGTEHCIEILQKGRFGEARDYSERALGIEASTRPPGNDPQVVCETARKVGLVDDTLLPLESAHSLDEYYTPKPLPQNIKAKELEWITTYDLGHEWLAGDPISMKECLTYSPLGVGVYAWQMGNQGYYVRPPNGRDGHWVVIYGYVDNQFWKCFDTYDGGLKKLDWNFGFSAVKRFHLEKKVISPKANIIMQLIDLIFELIGLKQKEGATIPTPQPIVPPTPNLSPKRDFLTEFCNAISTYEGGVGDLNHRNNNPGNCRYYSGGYLKIYGVVKKDPNGFAIFKDWDTGFLYLKNMIKYKAIKRPTQTITQFMSIYAPFSDGNNPVLYADYIGKQLGVNPDQFTMGQVIA